MYGRTHRGFDCIELLLNVDYYPDWEDDLFLAGIRKCLLS